MKTICQSSNGDLKYVVQNGFLIEESLKKDHVFRKPVIQVSDENYNDIVPVVKKYVDVRDNIRQGDITATLPVDDKFHIRVRTERNQIHSELIGNTDNKVHGDRNVALSSLEDCLILGCVCVSGHSDIRENKNIGKGYGKAMYSAIEHVFPCVQIPYGYDRNRDLESISTYAKNLWTGKMQHTVFPIHDRKMEASIQACKDVIEDSHCSMLSKIPRLEDAVNFMLYIHDNPDNIRQTSSGLIELYAEHDMKPVRYYNQDDKIISFDVARNIVSNKIDNAVNTYLSRKNLSGQCSQNEDLSLVFQNIVKKYNNKHPNSTGDMSLFSHCGQSITP